VTTGELLALFDAAFDAQREAVGALGRVARRGRGDGHPGQYALDVVADVAILDVLQPAGVAVLSEESGRTGPADAAITVVVDPVDGSTNCARGIPYWAISLCAVDADGPLCALVANGATGERNTAVRGQGAWRDGEEIHAATTTRLADSVIGIDHLPPRDWGAKQYRGLGSIALGLCDVATGGLEGWVQIGSFAAPWDYLGGLLVACEAGAQVVDGQDRELVTLDPNVLRQIVATATPELLAEVRGVALS
jgi:fructose-1,6-bisphosphatase/inositol monophosphatase family enzyme